MEGLMRECLMLLEPGGVTLSRGGISGRERRKHTYGWMDECMLSVQTRGRWMDGSVDMMKSRQIGS